MSFVETLEPQILWRHFDRILTIPRGSKQEEAMRQYVISVADAKGLEHSIDAAGNLVVRKPGAPGRENDPVMILQSHLDMVNEKNSDVTHDFDKDPIVPRRDGDYLNATGTTLGADNGIGVAAMLALIDASDVKHPPLELLFTIDEETGLTGAADLDASMLTGMRLMNLDTEEEYTVTVGCAGGAGCTLRLPLSTESAQGAALQVALRGMHGGHSGLDIHLGRGNAVKLLARMLNAVPADSFRLAKFEGGNKHNAIPREAFAVLVVVGEVSAVKKALQTEFDAIQAEYSVAEPGMQLELADTQAADKAWSSQSSSQVIRFIEALPHGVIAMSADIPGLVETSTNLATVVIKDDALVVGTSSRSSVGSALRSVQRQIRAVGELAGATVEMASGYPGWKPNLSSPLLKEFEKIHQDVQGREAEIVAVHAGLECGIVGEKVPGMDMISFGPQIEHPHSPNERVHVDSVGRFYRLLVATLEA